MVFSSSYEEFILRTPEVVCFVGSVGKPSNTSVITFLASLDRSYYLPSRYILSLYYYLL